VEAIATVTWRSVLVYWLAAAAIATYLFQERRERAAFQPVVAEAPRAPLVSASPESIDRVRVARGSTTIELVRTDGRWAVAPPSQAKLSSDLVDALIDTLASIPPAEVVSEGSASGGEPASAVEYGLEPPHYRVALISGSEPVAEVELGQRNPTRTAVYARVAGEPRLYLMGLNAQYYVDLIFEQADLGIGFAR
jgi:hypothetical protein